MNTHVINNEIKAINRLDSWLFKTLTAIKHYLIAIVWPSYLHEVGSKAMHMNRPEKEALRLIRKSNFDHRAISYFLHRKGFGVGDTRSSALELCSLWLERTKIKWRVANTILFRKDLCSYELAKQLAEECNYFWKVVARVVEREDCPLEDARSMLLKVRENTSRLNAAMFRTSVTKYTNPSKRAQELDAMIGEIL